MRMTKILYSVFLITILAFAGSGVALAAAPAKVGIINLQEILAKSKAGKAAAKRLESKAEKFKGKFQSEQDQIKALQEEIKKKSSAWSEDKRAAKLRDLQKAGREYKEKTSDASFELKQLQEKELAPILETLRDIVQQYGKKKGYAVILEKMPGVAYFDDSADITQEITKELNTKMDGK